MKYAATTIMRTAAACSVAAALTAAGDEWSFDVEADAPSVVSCAVGRDFLWGCQLGWNSDWPFDAKHKEHLSFTLRLCRERLSHKDFFLYGELLGELPTPPGMPIVSGTWKRKPACRFRLPAAMGTIWRARDGRRLVCLVNVSGNEQPFTYRLDGAPARTLMLPPRSVRSIVE